MPEKEKKPKQDDIKPDSQSSTRTGGNNPDPPDDPDG